MIASIRGRVIDKANETVLIDIGGVGVEVLASRTALEQCTIDEITSLPTRLIVREDSLTLFGFGDKTERKVFDALIKVSGVGPKLAIVILGTLSVDNLRHAILSDRPELITRVPGIGKKTAQKILLELKDKLPVGLDAVPMAELGDDLNADVMDALIALGFSVVEAQSAIQALPNDAPPDTEERVRLALQFISTG